MCDDDPFVGMVVDTSPLRSGAFRVLSETKMHHVDADRLLWTSKRNYRKAKIHFLFSQESPEFHDAVEFDDVALYSATDQLTARQTAKFLLTLPGVTPASTVTDGTSCIGGNTIEFARAFAHVHAVELDAARAGMLTRNLALLALSDTVTVHCRDYCQVHTTLTQDVVFLDPPWGGKRYKQLEQIRLTMSDTDVGDLCAAVLRHTAHVVVKVPANFFVAHFARTVGRRVRVMRLTTKVLLLVVTGGKVGAKGVPDAKSAPGVQAEGRWDTEAVAVRERVRA